MNLPRRVDWKHSRTALCGLDPAMYSLWQGPQTFSSWCHNPSRNMKKLGHFNTFCQHNLYNYVMCGNIPFVFSICSHLKNHCQSVHNDVVCWCGSPLFCLSLCLNYFFMKEGISAPDGTWKAPWNFPVLHWSLARWPTIFIASNLHSSWTGEVL